MYISSNDRMDHHEPPQTGRNATSLLERGPRDQNRLVNILHLEHDVEDSGLVAALLQSEGLFCEITRVVDREHFIERLIGGKVDLVISSTTMTGFSSMEALAVVRDRFPHVPFIVLSGVSGEEAAIEAMQHGAADYVLKQRNHRLLPAILRALKLKHPVPAQPAAGITSMVDWAQRVSDILACSPVVAFSWIQQEGWPVSFVSDSVQQFGYHPDDFLKLGVSYSDIIHPDDLARIVEEVQLLDSTGGSESVFEYRIIRKNGDVVWVEDHTRVRRDAASAMLVADGIVIDITQRKLREIESELNQARLMRLYELASMECTDESELVTRAVNVAVSLTSSETGFVRFISPDAASTDAMLASRMISPCWSGEAEDSITESMAEAIAASLRLHEPVVINKYVTTVTTVGNSADTFRLDRHVVVPVVAEGRVVLVVGVCNKNAPYSDNDVRVLKLMMMEMWSLLKRLRGEIELKKLWQAVEQSPASIAVTDTNGVMEYVNPRLLEMTGYTSEEVIGQQTRMFQSGETDPEVYEQLWSTIQSGKEWKGTLKNKRKDGQPYWEAVSISPVTDLKGEIVNFVAVKQDVSDRMALEQSMLAATEDASRATKLKDHFIAMISHEIRTPLNVIFGYSGLIRTMYMDRIEPIDQYMFEAIEDAGSRLMRTVDLLLAASSLSVGSYSPIVEEFDVHDTLERLLKQYYETARSKGLYLELLCHSRKQMVLLDKFGFEQTVQNLLDNALKFTQDGGVFVRTNIEDGRLRVDIQDTGKGMSQDFIAKAYSLFTQEIEGYSRPYEGLGLGLSLVKKYVEINNGTISIESGQGQGSTFSLFFPLVN